jgi:hypothetical protein
MDDGESYPHFVPTGLPTFRPYGTPENTGTVVFYPYHAPNGAPVVRKKSYPHFVPTGATHITPLTGLPLYGKNHTHISSLRVLPISRP